MTFSDSHKEMSPVEQHGVQLRTTTDLLEMKTELYADDAVIAVLEAEDLLAAVQRATANKVA